MSKVLDRLGQMIKDRYGCHISYKSLGDLSEQEKLQLCSLNTLSMVSKETSIVLFPVSVKGELVGAVEVDEANQLGARSLMALKDVVTMVLESLHLTANSIELINLLEQQLVEKKAPSDSNVISLNQYKQIQGMTSALLPKVFKRRTTFNVPCLIEAKNRYDIHKMALEVHDFSRRMAFVFFNMLEENVRQSYKDWETLGNISLFIPDISLLKDEEIFNLINFLKGARTQDSPQIIAGSSLQIKDILDKELLPRELIQLLNVAYLRMDEPFATYKKQGLVEYFFDSFKSTHPLV
ncbi:MAG: hypothetical protein KDD40_10250 [Bdellovibrionales bacterium]|nr:hypothetical protein [Bdellovibrionales bacterium]